ncbi:MAG: hypothetical protein IJ169_00860 [Paludibacteraceae bacterium]|nr:hypothetical protein [Paludibacteraceae bacterium]
MPIKHDIWQWQEPGTAWKGAGIYHVTLTIPSRMPLLGELVIPDNDPMQARVERTELGKRIRDCVEEIPRLHPEVKIIQQRMMPDHLHVILYVTCPMDVSIKMVVRGFWQGAKKHGRDYSASVNPHSMRDNERSLAEPIFTEMPFIRPMSHKGQLQTMIRYVQMNPQRLATKKLRPGFFCVQEGIEIGGRTYRGIGNAALLQAARFVPVHVRRTMTDEAMHGDNTRLRDYMNGCVLAARKGAVMVSPFISDKEKDVMAVLLAEGHPIIYIADNGFGNYYKPSGNLCDSVAAGRVLIISPWEYDAQKRHVTREECVAMNRMAEEICDTIASDSRKEDNQ